MRIRPSRYYIRNAPVSRLKSWVLETSLEGVIWTEIDRRTSSDELYGRVCEYHIPYFKSVDFRFIRLTQTGKNQDGVDLLRFCAFDFFRVLNVPFPLQTPTNLCGIITYLTAKHRHHLLDQNKLTITAKSTYNTSPVNAVTNLLAMNTRSDFWSKDAPGQWVSWDFHQMGIRLTHYAIKTSVSHQPRSWVIEVSVDGVTWVEVDRQTKTDALQGEREIVAFPIEKPPECRFFRITQTGPNRDETNYLALSAVELFGTLLL
jgi:hypothetical protein